MTAFMLRKRSRDSLEETPPSPEMTPQGPPIPPIMEMPDFMRSEFHDLTIKTVDMHTCGEPTRIIFAGFPRMTGTMLIDFLVACIS